MAASAILKLQRAGFSDEQVEALAEYFDEQLATKTDLTMAVEAGRTELKAAEARLEAAIEQVRGELKAVELRLDAAIGQVRGELKATEARLEAKIEQARGDTIKWMIGVGFAQAATILAVLRLFPGHS
ncbi:MAG: peptidase M23 [Alphaproteobacteria bacterium]